jgi:hypothetical protein
MTAAVTGEIVDLTPEPIVPTVDLRGRRFHVRPQGVSLLALMKFAVVAKSGIRDDDVEGLSAVYEMLQTCIAEDEWEAFYRHANKIGADDTDLQQVIAQAVNASQQLRATGAGSARPTQPSSGSPAGPPTTAPSSAAGSSSAGSSGPIRTGDVRVQRRLEAQGRPDLALVVLTAREASTGTSAG